MNKEKGSKTGKKQTHGSVYYIELPEHICNDSVRAELRRAPWWGNFSGLANHTPTLCKLHARSLNGN